MSSEKYEELSQERCEACRADAPKVSEDEARELLKQLSDWCIVSKDNISVLQKAYKFRDFKTALDFTNRIGEMAESLQHHPDILTSWGRVTVTWYTHKISGLHRNDFRCAARCDQLVT